MNILDPAFDDVWRDVQFECVVRVRDPRLLARFDAEDLYQEVQKAAYEARPDWTDGPEHLRSYLMKAVRHRFIDLYRQHVEADGRTVNAEVVLKNYDGDSKGIAATLAGRGKSPSSVFGTQEMIDAVRAAVARLPEPLRTVLVLTWFRGMTLRQIGVYLSMSTTTVHARLDEAEQRLADDTDPRLRQG